MSGACRRSAEYKREITKFHQAFPTVKEISVWNEVNRCQSRTRLAGQPTCGKEQRLASYFKATRQVFTSPGTKIVALDVLDEQNVRQDDLDDPQVQALRRLEGADPRLPQLLGHEPLLDDAHAPRALGLAAARCG